jgi:HTH-type transcriptional regulator, sugar sensing transcriptional regulator
MLASQLKSLGLSDKEAKVYLAMLELGPATVMDISTKAGINRPTTYVEIDSLRKRGLAAAHKKGSKRLFGAESPEQFEFYLVREMQAIDEKKELLGKMLPDLKAMYNLGEKKPQVRFFEGLEGLMKMQDEFLKAKPYEILAITSADDVLKVFPRQMENYSPERVKRKIPSRVIYTSVKGDFLKAGNVKALRQTRFISPDKMPFHADITIFGDAVAIAALKGNLSGAIIEHKEIAASFKGLFEFAWGILNT